ncbi:MAG: diaminopimelate epimerase [Bacillota bacterium]|nr:diaminopimelate epimerase [Bacillota bacterium]
MELKFIKTSPTENMTLLIETPVPREKQLETAEKLIAYGSVYAEQAGYIEAAKNPLAERRLQMMAGEFCGNASLSLAAVLAEEKGLQAGEEREIVLEVSGTDQLVRCQMKKEENGFYGRVAMPLPKGVERRSFSLNGMGYQLDVVAFEGISHIIVPTALWGEAGVKHAEQAAKEWAGEMPSAFGILLFDAKKNTLQPLVSVQGSTLIWERGCGSGTAAVGAYLAMQAGSSLFVSLKQPGGTMGAEVVLENGRIEAIFLTGRVSIVAKGTAYI